MTWDAAAHALIGIDAFDHIRRVEPLLLLLRLQAEHWWPPLFGILSLPAWLIGGRELSSPGLVSLASYCLIPPLLWLSIRRVTTALPILAFGLVALFALRSPQFLEMSTWSMLEPAAALFAAAAFYCFLAGPQSRARNWAYGLAGASTLLKYHYGFFLLVTLGAATVMELDRGRRQAAIQWMRSRLRQPSIWIPVAILAVAIAVRRILETHDPSPPIPGVPTLLWIAYILTLVAMIIRRNGVRQLWVALPPPIRQFISCGLIWPMVWFLDPANVQAWYRELRVQTDPPARWTEQLHEIAQFLDHHYFLGPFVLTAALIGLGLALAEAFRRGRTDVLAIACHGLWITALMSLSKFSLEPRFLATPVLALFLSAALGWNLFLERRPPILRFLCAAALLGLLVGDQAFRSDEWAHERIRRRVYFYLSSDPPDGFVRATVKAFSQGHPVLIVLPPDRAVVSPTIRLGLRLAMPDVRPDTVIVRGGDLRGLSERLRRFPGGLVGAETDSATLHRVVEESGMQVLSITAGPALQSGDRALVMARVSR
jgi:hypothetical protein